MACFEQYICTLAFLGLGGWVRRSQSKLKLHAAGIAFGQTGLEGERHAYIACPWPFPIPSAPWHVHIVVIICLEIRLGGGVRGLSNRGLKRGGETAC